MTLDAPQKKLILSPRLRLLVGILSAIILVSIALLLGLRKTVTLSLDGQSRTLTTYSFTVADLLHDQGIALSPSDDLSPSPDTWLKNRLEIRLRHAIPVQVLADGELISTLSAWRVPATILEAAGVMLLPGDIVLSNGREIDPTRALPDDAQAITLQVVPAVSLTLHVDGKERSLTSAVPTLGSALWQAGITFFAADELTPAAHAPLSPGQSATLRRSREVTIQTQAGVSVIRTPADTVGEALEDAGLALQGLDYSLPSPETRLPAGGVIQLVRVTEDVLVEQTPLPFESQYQPVADLEIDNQVIVQTGEYGLTARRLRVRYEDGQEVSRLVENEWVARQPVPRIVGYGTLVVMHTAVVDGVEIQYWRAIDMYATSYHPSEVGDITASGLPLKKGVVAIDRRYVAFYTQLYIPGYGEAIAADVGGGVIGRWIDLGYSDHDYVPWHQWVTVYFLWPPPANIVWIFP